MAVDFDGDNDAKIGQTGYKNTNPDFSECANGMGPGLQEGVLGPIGTELGANNLPILLNPNHLFGFSNQANFDQWWLGNTVGVTNPGALGPTVVLLELKQEGGKWVHKPPPPFHPLKNKGFHDPVNYKYPLKQNAGFFAIRCQSEFVYKKTYVNGVLQPSSFTFTGDDDVWIYIDRKLAVDIGGIHGPLSRTVDLHSLNLVDGCRYPIHLFQADRCCCGSNFQFETAMEPVRGDDERGICPNSQSEGDVCTENNHCYNHGTSVGMMECKMATTGDAAGVQKVCTKIVAATTTPCTPSDGVAITSACKCSSSSTTNECGINQYCFDNGCHSSAKVTTTPCVQSETSPITGSAAVLKPRLENSNLKVD